jgi:hypothetical protein
MIHTHIYKSWIKNNPDLAIKHVKDICNEAEKSGMKIHYFEDAHYVDIVAAHKESDITMQFGTNPC